MASTWDDWLETDSGEEYKKLRDLLERAKYKFIIHVKIGVGWKKKHPTNKTPASNVGWSIRSPKGVWKWATTANVIDKCRKLSESWTAWLFSSEGVEHKKLRDLLERAKYKFITQVKTEEGKWEEKTPTSETPVSKVRWSIVSPKGVQIQVTTKDVIAECRKLVPLIQDFFTKFPDAADLIRQSPAAMKLVIEAENTGVKFGGHAEEGPAKIAWAYTNKNRIYVPKARTDKVLAMRDFLFELNNAVRAPKFARLYKMATQGKFKGAKQFAEEVAKLEVEGMLRIGEMWIKMKKTIGATGTKYDNDFYLSEYMKFKKIQNGKKAKDVLVKAVLKRVHSVGRLKGKTVEQVYMDQYKSLRGK